LRHRRAPRGYTRALCNARRAVGVWKVEMRAAAQRSFVIAAALALLVACVGPARAQEVVSEAAALEESGAELMRLEEERVAAEAARLEQLRQLYAEGLYARKSLEESEAAHAASLARLEALRLKAAETERQAAEARAAAEAAKTQAALVRPAVRTTGGARLSTNSAMIRYTGKTAWSVADLSSVRAFYESAFGRALPVSALGQSATHDRFGYDHRHAVDVALHPDSAEGRALIQHLQTRGIAFTAFRAAVPGVATGPHIHIGRPSGRVG
jgi:hypothetical protein